MTAGASRLGLGASRFGSFNNPAAPAESERLVHAALDLGVRVLDTASIYGQGDSERIIGRAIAGRRDDAFVVTKAGQTFAAKYRLLRPVKPLLRPLLAARKGRGGGSIVTAQRDAAMDADWRADAIVASLNTSLKRLRTDRVEAFLLHSPPATVAADPALAAAMARVREAGKARLVGVSCDSLATLDAALAHPDYLVVQLPWDVIELLGKRREAMAARGIMVLAREVVTQQPSLSPLDAVRRSLTEPAVACTLVRTGNVAHLRAMAQAAA
jgi:aryl-alcohol dehydrogenase-like predicted oxidoreductase